MEHCVGNSSVQSDVAKFTDALDAKVVDLGIGLRNYDGLHLLDVGVDWHQVLGEIVVVVTRGAAIDLGCLMQRRGNAPYLSAHELTFGSLGIDDPSGSERAHQAWRT